MLNHIVLMGRLTRDPELRRTQSGLSVAAFTIAVDRDFGTREDGSKETDFVDIVAWRSTAEFVQKYFSKGRMAVVSGRLQLRKWTDNQGNKRISAEVVAESVYFGDSKRDGDSGSSYGGSYAGCGNYAAPTSPCGYVAQGQASGAQMQMAGDYAVLEDDDGNLPF